MGNSLEASREIPCKADTVTEQELLMLEERFRRMDTDGSGKLEPQEFLDVPGKEDQ